MTGTNNLEEAIKLKDNLITILNEAGMKLRKWSSNSCELLDTIASEQQAKLSKKIANHQDETCIKVKYWE